MKIADKYFNICREIAVRHPELMNRRVRYQVFAREDGVIAGVNRAVNFIKENTYGPLKITGLKDGERFYSEIPALTYEGLFYEVVTLETTLDGFLSYSGSATSMSKIVEAADGVPTIDMSARHYPWEMIEQIASASYLGGASGTSTPSGYDYVQKWYNPGDEFKIYASLPHAMAVVVAEMAEKEWLFPSVMAAKLRCHYFPDQPIIVLVDYEGRELEVTKQAFELFGNKLFAVRLDTHGGRKMQGVSSGDNGVTLEANLRERNFLNYLGAKNTKIIVSSGFNEKKVRTFREANAPMDFIGTGSFVKFIHFTADASHVWENGEWKFRTKAGRIHKPAKNHKVLFERQ